MTWQILPPPISRTDFEKVLARQRPTVGKADLEVHNRFTKEFGEEGWCPFWILVTGLLIDWALWLPSGWHCKSCQPFQEGENTCVLMLIFACFKSGGCCKVVILISAWLIMPTTLAFVNVLETTAGLFDHYVSHIMKMSQSMDYSFPTNTIGIFLNAWSTKQSYGFHHAGASDTKGHQLNSYIVIKDSRKLLHFFLLLQGIVRKIGPVCYSITVPYYTHFPSKQTVIEEQTSRESNL